MKAKIFLLIPLIIFITKASFSQGLGGDKDKDKDKDNGRINWFPPFGNVGVGTRYPSVDFEVLGDVKISGGLLGNNFTFQNNGNIGGKLGIGVNSPSEKLEVLGNIKVQGNISAFGLTLQSLSSTSASFTNLTVTQNTTLNTVISTSIQAGQLNSGLSTFTDNATFNKNILIAGRLGVGQPTPSEVLDVNGNIKSSGSLLSNSIQTGSAQVSTINVGQNAVFNGAVGIGVSTPLEKLHISGNLRMDGNITANAITSTSLQTGQLASGAASFSDIVSLSKGLYVAGKVGIGVASPSESLETNGNIKTSGTVVSSVISSGDAQISKTLSVGGTTTVSDLNVNGKLVALSLSLDSISTNNSVNVGQSLTVGGKSQLNGDVNIKGSLTGTVLTYNTLNATQATITQALTVNGGGSYGSNLQVKGQLGAQSINVSDINATNNIITGQNLTVGGTSQLTGDVIVGGKISTGIIEASEFRSTGGGSPFNFDNAVISQTLAIGSDKGVPTNYKLAVGGNIIATGIDVKIPQKWPDYVFTKEYGLISLEELDEFIRQHGHLPAIPSAKEMEEKQNYNVAEMDAKLLEKVEQLTLYIIQLKKEIDLLKTGNK